MHLCFQQPAQYVSAQSTQSLWAQTEISKQADLATCLVSK